MAPLDNNCRSGRTAVTVTMVCVAAATVAYWVGRRALRDSTVSSIKKVEGEIEFETVRHCNAHTLLNAEWLGDEVVRGVRFLPSKERWVRRYPVSSQSVYGPGPVFVPELRIIKFSGRQFTLRRGVEDGDLKFLDRLPHLRSVNLAFCRITDKGLVCLARVTTLERLVLDSTDISGEGLSQLRLLPRLTALSLNDCKITGAVKALSAVRNLRVLSLGGVRLSGDDIRGFVALRKVSTLRVPDTRLNDASIHTMAQMPKLRTLDIGRTPISNLGVSALTNARLLQDLRLTGCYVDDACLASIRRMAALRSVSLVDTKVSAEGIAGLQRDAPNIAIMHDGTMRPTFRSKKTVENGLDGEVNGPHLGARNGPT